MAGPPDAARYAQVVEELRALEEEYNEFRESSRQLEAELEQVTKVFPSGFLLPIVCQRCNKEAS